MSIAELGGPTPQEISVLMMARAQRDAGVEIEGSAHEAEIRVAARRLVERGFGDMFVSDKGETFQSNSAGARWLSAHLEQQVGR